MIRGGALAASLASMRAWARTVIMVLQADSCTIRRKEIIMAFQRQLPEEGHKAMLDSFCKT